MGKTAYLTVVQKTLINILHDKGKPQKVIAERNGCLESAVSKLLHGKLTGSGKCGRKRCTSSRDGRSLERIISQSRFKNLELHKEWTEAGVSASRATTHRHVQEIIIQSQCSHLPGHFRALHASIFWQTLWRSWFPFPAGLGICPQCQNGNWFAAHGIAGLDLPTDLPDLNPINNLGILDLNQGRSGANFQPGTFRLKPGLPFFCCIIYWVIQKRQHFY